jgi:predicted RNA-binding Zn ribbon-like protein
VTDADLDELPLLGESLALDTVNSRYGVGPDIVDFLGDAWIATWVDGLVSLHGLRTDPFAGRDAAELRAVRDAAWTIVYATLDGTRPPARSITTLNHAARVVPAITALRWGATGPARDTRPTAAHPGPLAGRLAIATIDLVTGADAARVRRCARPGCSMLFVQHHGHRRFCHPACSHLMRQDRYRVRHPR